MELIKHQNGATKSKNAVHVYTTLALTRRLCPSSRSLQIKPRKEKQVNDKNGKYQQSGIQQKSKKK
jgi:hypothetical protein